MRGRQRFERRQLALVRMGAKAGVGYVNRIKKLSGEGFRLQRFQNDGFPVVAHPDGLGVEDETLSATGPFGTRLR